MLSRKGIKAVTRVVPFQKVHLCTIFILKAYCTKYTGAQSAPVCKHALFEGIKPRSGECMSMQACLHYWRGQVFFQQHGPPFPDQNFPQFVGQRPKTLSCLANTTEPRVRSKPCTTLGVVSQWEGMHDCDPSASDDWLLNIAPAARPRICHYHFASADTSELC